ncbi:MAG TPA: hypothetical protein GX507_08440 [Clostridia bacterium]|nr:hypothetical protein [Clostridia bacterium]
MFIWLLRGAYRGFRNGLIGTVIGAVSWLLALLVATFAAQPLAAWLEAHYGWASSIGGFVARTANISALAPNLPVDTETIAGIPEAIRQLGLPLPLDSLITGYAMQLAETASATSGLTWGDLLARALGYLIFNTMCFVAVFILSGVAIAALGNILGSGLKHLLGPVLDRSLGSVLGAGIYAVIAAVILTFFVAVGSVPLFSEVSTAVQNSRLGGWLLRIGLALTPALGSILTGRGGPG